MAETTLETSGSMLLSPQRPKPKGWPQGDRYNAVMPVKAEHNSPPQSVEERIAQATAELTEQERREVADFAEFLCAKRSGQALDAASDQPLDVAHLRGTLKPWADRMGSGVEFQHAARALRQEPTHSRASP